MAGDMETFAPLVDEHCVVHYPGNHFLSGDHVGRAAIVELYPKLYRIGIEQGTFIGELHDALTSDDHALRARQVHDRARPRACGSPATRSASSTSRTARWSSTGCSSATRR